MIACGWCGHATEPELCGYCGRDPTLPYVHRGTEPVQVGARTKGRPGLTQREIARRLDDAAQQLGRDATTEQIAELLGISTKTVRRWKTAIGVRA